MTGHWSWLSRVTQQKHDDKWQDILAAKYVNIFEPDIMKFDRFFVQSIAKDCMKAVNAKMETTAKGKHAHLILKKVYKFWSVFFIGTHQFMNGPGKL